MRNAKLSREVLMAKFIDNDEAVVRGKVVEDFE